jgi:hypothetical protein
VEEYLSILFLSALQKISSSVREERPSPKVVNVFKTGSEYYLHFFTDSFASQVLEFVPLIGIVSC